MVENIDEFGRAIKYVSPNIQGQEKAIKKKISNFTDALLKNRSTGEKRYLLGQASQALHLVIDYVMKNLPKDVKRVDGTVISPLLKQVISDKLAKLPKPVVQEEV